jgi:multidrug resistance efflux pump
VKRALVLLCACNGGAATTTAVVEPVRTAAVHAGSVVDRVLLTGEIYAASSAQMNVPRTEQMPLAIRWMADDGAVVKAGERVLEFDNSAFTKAIEEKRLAVIEAEMTWRAQQDLTAIETAGKQTELAQHKIALDKATVRASVPADLLANRDAQERQLDKKRAEVAFAKAEAGLASQKDQAALDLRVKQIELDKAKRAIDAAEATIAELVVKAPRDGVIVVENHPWEGRKFHSGDTVQAGMTIMSIPDPGQPMEVHAELSDVDDGRIALGMAGTCTLDSYPAAPIACTVSELSPVARTKGAGSLRRAFAATLTLGKTDQTMRPGMSVKVELQRPGIERALVVPRGAIVDGKHARLPKGELRDVTLGACDAQGCAVQSGLVEGEIVVVGGGS